MPERGAPQWEGSLLSPYHICIFKAIVINIIIIITLDKHHHQGIPRSRAGRPSV